MTLADDIANDYIGMDGIEDVILTPKNPVATAVPGVKALRRVLSYKEIMKSGEFGVEPNDMVWNFWVSTLGGVVPKNRDTLTDSDNIVWTILSLEKLTLGTRWKAFCRQEV